MRSPAYILRRLKERAHDSRRRSTFAKSLVHLHGPSVLDAPAGEVLAIVLVRDGSYYMDVFFEHYRQLGVKHFAFIDNGSTDDTIERLKAEPGVIIDQCALPLAQYEDLIRQYPAEAYGKNRWCLYVDMDELFEFEGSDTLGLDGLISYLEAQKATALIAQMLEMFPKAPLSEAAHLGYSEAVAQYRYFDISHVKRFDYHSPEIAFSDLLEDNCIADPRCQFLFGGVRGKVFGENCCLTKHPLVYNGPTVTPAPHPHLSMGVRCADITGLIKHYKFAGNAAARDIASSQTSDLAHGEDTARATVLSTQPDLTLFSVDARPWNRIELLIRAGFLLGSERYSRFIQDRMSA